MVVVVELYIEGDYVYRGGGNRSPITSKEGLAWLRATLMRRYHRAPESYQDAVDLVNSLDLRVDELEHELRQSHARREPDAKRAA